jgi:lipid A 3-O-deacylase
MMVALLIISVVNTTTLAPDAHAQTWSSWTAYWENDSFVLPRYGSDKSYTNGIRFALSRKTPHGWADDVGEKLEHVTKHIPGLSFRSFDAGEMLVFGQNFFTPLVITTFEPDPQDRPFAGLLFGGLRIDQTESAAPDQKKFHKRVQHSLEVVGGFMGPLALADQVQTGVHLLRGSRIPKGWERQLGTELAVNANLSSRAKIGWHFLDIVPTISVAAGTIHGVKLR